MLALTPISYQFHPEVWVMLVGLVGAYIYMIKVVGPTAVPKGETIVTHRQVGAFGLAMVLLWFASDFPVHDIGEDYLYSMHMLQHMIISYFVPPLALLATPTWLARLMMGDGAGYRFFRFLTRPLVAAIIVSAVTILLHIPSLVTLSIENGPFHYFMHFIVVVSSLIMWAPVCGPIPEFRMSTGLAIVYLFLLAFIPSVPAAWLTFAETPVYSVYNRPVRLWGLSVIDDQQLAGGIMKVGGGLFMWAVTIYLFFAKFVPENGGRDRDTLTTEDVETAFAASEPTPEPHRTP